MELRFDESKIQYWACKYVNNLSEEEALQEEELLALEPKIKAHGYLLKCELVKVVEWKLQNQPHRLSKNLMYIDKNCDNHIRDITAEAFSTTDIDDSNIVLWKNLSGVGSAIGSAILHLYHKDPYPIWDWRALESVGERKGRGVWRRYVKYCRDLAARNSVDMRTLDRALWKYSQSTPSRNK